MLLSFPWLGEGVWQAGHLTEVLQKLGIQTRMLHFIVALYAAPSAIHNGTIQGCPLSPMLSYLYFEPFLRRLWENDNIKGITIEITIENHQYKVPAFLDDVLLFFSEPHITLPNLIQDFHLFPFVSNLKIYFNKSHAFPGPLIKHCKNNFPFTWQSEVNLRYSAPDASIETLR